MADSLTRRDVEDIALLARLALEDDEIEHLRADLTSILAYMDALQKVDTTGVEPMTHAVPMHLRLRDDVAGASLDMSDALDRAPARDGDYFEVPHVIQSGSGQSGSGA